MCVIRFSLFFIIISAGLLWSIPSGGQNRALEIPLDTSYTVWSTQRKLIRDYPNIKPVTPFESTRIKEQKDIVYLTLEDSPFGKRDLHADVFIPNKKAKHFPALVLVHGGGWRAGNKKLNTPMAQQLAANGFVVVSVEYRLSLEAKYPAAIHDLKAVIRWMRANAKTYQIDEAHIAIGGSSAGGQLAALVGATNDNSLFEGSLSNLNYSSHVQAVVDMDGLLDFTDSESLALKRTENSADVFWLEGFYDDNKKKWEEASALHWVNRQSPPYIFINSSQTRFHAGCKNMVSQLANFSIYNEVHDLPGSPHSFWLFHPWFDPTVEFITNFLNKVFNDKR